MILHDCSESSRHFYSVRTSSGQSETLTAHTRLCRAHAVMYHPSISWQFLEHAFPR